jgi:hypothetical protein
VSASKSLSQLIYWSRQQIAPEHLDRDIEAIIDVSVERNRTVDVTGLLLAHQGWFLQVLEGPATIVQTTYGRIINDHRHTGGQVIAAAPISERVFGEWNMCARRLSPKDDAILNVLDGRGSFEPTKLNAVNALRLLTAVREIRNRTVLAAGGSDHPQSGRLTVNNPR